MEKDGRARARTVRVGTWKDTDWIVLSGLDAGERVIVNQLQRLKDNLPVKASPEEPGSKRAAAAP